jgi:hypothetical protein
MRANCGILQKRAEIGAVDPRYGLLGGLPLVTFNVKHLNAIPGRTTVQLYTR